MSAPVEQMSNRDLIDELCGLQRWFGEESPSNDEFNRSVAVEQEIMRRMEASDAAVGGAKQ